MSTSAVSSVPKGSTAQQAPESDAYDKMDLGQFIKLLVTEMQNQDPTSPMDNSQILQQISQIKAIASNDKMSTTLNSLKLQQDMVSGNVMLNQTIKAIDTSGVSVTGKVDKVTVADNKVQLHVGEHTIDISKVAEINGGETPENKISNALTSMQLRQDVESGNMLLNQTVRGPNSNGKVVSGKVEKVTVDGKKVQLHIGSDTIDLANVLEVNGSALAAVQNEQNLVSGSALLYRSITGKTSTGDEITGYVDQVSIDGDKVQLHLGDKIIDLDSVTHINSSIGSNTGS
jgi:flagellar basal-body rod modification protein FlgD